MMRLVGAAIAVAGLILAGNGVDLGYDMTFIGVAWIAIGEVMKGLREDHDHE